MSIETKTKNFSTKSTDSLKSSQSNLTHSSDQSYTTMYKECKKDEQLIELENNICLKCQNIDCKCIETINTNQVFKLECTLSKMCQECVILVTQNDIVFKLPIAVIPNGFKIVSAMTISFQESNKVSESSESVSNIQKDILSIYKCKYL